MTAAAFTGSAGLVKNVAVDRGSSPDNLPSTADSQPLADSPTSQIAEPTPVPGGRATAPLPNATPNPLIVAQGPATSLDLSLANGALGAEKAALNNSLPTPQPQLDVSAKPLVGAGTSQTFTRSVPKASSGSLYGKELGTEAARLPQNLSPADDKAANSAKRDSPTADKMPSRLAEKGAASSDSDPLSPFPSRSGDNPMPVVPGSTLLSSIVNVPAAAASVSVATPAPATHGQPEVGPANAQPRSAEPAGAADPATPISKVDVARLVRSVSGSELRVGVRSEEFGAVTIRAELGREQLSAHISTENERLGSALSAHLSSMQDAFDNRLGKGVTLKATVSVSSDPSAFGSSTGRDSGGHQRSAQQGGSSSFGGSSSGRQHRYDPSISIGSASVSARTAALTLSSSQPPLDRLSIRI